MSRRYLISRRTALKGLGASIALPMLDAMVPARAQAAATAASAPVRAAFIFVPNGMSMADFTPSEVGRDFALTPTLEPLASVRDHVLIFSGLTHDNGRAKGDGAGDHARASASFLTGAHPYKTAGKDIRLGVSVDQFAASQVGDQTMLRSLEVGCESPQPAGNCDSGYSCAYSSHISWRSETTPVPQEVNPSSVFDRLFGSDDEREAAENRARRLANRKSILDFVLEDVSALQRRLGIADRNKLDEYTTSIRDIERRIEWARSDLSRAPQPEMAKPDGIPAEWGEHIRLMYDMIVLAFQSDLTRVTSFMVSRAGNNRSFPDLAVSEGHHWLSHHGGEEEKLKHIRKIDRFYMDQFAYFLERLQSIREGEGTLLDNAMILMGSGLADGNAHAHHDLPLLLAGHGGGTIDTGRHLRYPTNTPVCNLFLSMLDRLGAEAPRFGDSTGRLNDLTEA